MDSSQMTCALKVDTEAAGWHKTMMKVLKKITGVSYSIDAGEGMAYVSGRIDPNKLLTKLMRSGKHAELLWVRAGDHHYHHHHSYNSNGYADQYNSFMGRNNHYHDDLHDPFRYHPMYPYYGYHNPNNNGFYDFY